MKFSRQGAHRLREKMKVGANTSVPVSRDGMALKKASKGTLVSGDVLRILLSPSAKSGKLPTSLPCRESRVVNRCVLGWSMVSVTGVTLRA